VHHRAYSVFHVRSVDEDARVIEGIATTPETDRMGDVIEPAGAKFSLPLPLLWQHRSDQPIGQVVDAAVTPEGIRIRAKIAKGLLPRIDEAWALIRAGLVRGLSIGFRSLGEPERIEGTFGLKFSSWELLEVSAVTIPANADASITLLKSLDAPHLAALGQSEPTHAGTPGATGTVVRLARKDAPTTMKTIQEQISAFEATRAAKDAERQGLMTKAAESGETFDAESAEQYDTLATEIKAVDDHLKRLRDLEESNQLSAVAVKGATTEEAARARTRGDSPVITVRDNLPPGIGFARAVLCRTAAFLSQGNFSPIEIAKQRYPGDARLQMHIKATVPAGTTTDATWAGALVDQTNLASEFIEFLRPQTVLGKFGANGIPSLRRVPFNIRVVGQTTGGNAWWVGQGAPKPVTSFGVEPTTLLWAKIAAIAVITEELARFSSPSAEMLVRDQLASAIRDQLDRDFVDPDTAAVTNVSPASITNGLTALTSAGTSADNVRTDLQNLIETFILQNINPAQLVLIMPNTLALAASLMVNSLGQDEFPGLTMNGGTLRGIPVITSQHAANQSGAGNLVIAVNADEIFLADDGAVTVDASREASLQLLDDPTNNSSSGTATSVVSMWQTNSIALRAERFINWARRRTGAVAYMDDVNWGSIGSPS
jgi:HK97 family phage major capsid protein/HK97 family phage prohead protease